MYSEVIPLKALKTAFSPSRLVVSTNHIGLSDPVNCLQTVCSDAQGWINS